MNESDRVMGEDIPIGVEFPEEIEIVEEPVSFDRAELKIPPDIPVLGVIIPGDDIVQATNDNMSSKEQQECR